MAVYQKYIYIYISQDIHLDLNSTKQLAMTEAPNINYFDFVPRVYVI